MTVSSRGAARGTEARQPGPARQRHDVGQPQRTDDMTHTAPGQAAREQAAYNQAALDGQDVVDQSGERSQERAAIARAAEEQEALSREERAREPSARFWDSRRSQIGAIMALFAGVLTLAERVWPIAAPQARGSAGAAWALITVAIAVVYLGSFFLADRRWKMARVVLVSAAVVHLIVGLWSGTIVGLQVQPAGVWALVFDVVPALVALVAAFLIAPPPARGEVSEEPTVEPFRV